MNSTEQLLAELRSKLEAGDIHPEALRQVLQATDNLAGIESDGDLHSSKPGSVFHNFTAAKVLYTLGGIIALLGIGTFVAQIWSDIGSVLRIFITLGFGVLLSFIGTIFFNKTTTTLAELFYFGGGLLISAGVLVFYYELFSFSSILEWLIAFTYLTITVRCISLYQHSKQRVFLLFIVLNSVLALGYGIAGLNSLFSNASTAFYLLASVWFILFAILYVTFLYLVTKHPVWILLATLTVTAAVYSIASALLAALPVTGLTNIYFYVTILIGVFYMVLGYRVESTFADTLQSALYFFGSLGILYTAFQLLADSIVWELLYVPLALGMLAVSTYVRSRLVLIISTLAIISYITWITGKYFADSLGWPISLMLLGLICIGLGYASLEINKRYIATN